MTGDGINELFTYVGKSLLELPVTVASIPKENMKIGKAKAKKKQDGCC
jgi:hypothetical protein